MAASESSESLKIHLMDAQKEMLEVMAVPERILKPRVRVLTEADVLGPIAHALACMMTRIPFPGCVLIGEEWDS